jgi:hypothetical protein
MLKAELQTAPVGAKRYIDFGQNDLGRLQTAGVLPQLGVFDLDDVNAPRVDQLENSPVELLGEEQSSVRRAQTPAISVRPRLPVVKVNLSAQRPQSFALAWIVVTPNEDQEMEVAVPLKQAQQIELAHPPTVVGRKDRIRRDHQHPRPAPADRTF